MVAGAAERTGAAADLDRAVELATKFARSQRPDPLGGTSGNA